MAKKNTQKNLRVVNSEQNDGRHGGSALCCNNLSLPRVLRLFGVATQRIRTALDSNTAEDLGLSAESDRQQGRVGLCASSKLQECSAAKPARAIKSVISKKRATRPSRGLN